ncbi:pirin family protein [Aneurinibacillus sp. Ricciae_BoGa-3]|uniref:pirin family protein n=1 Tax=Aneurinibacillus sp. Ricciae_BoGa-3 TaxID=3022697 RepID=UPI00233F814C|nr:pirin family protein [Aneurinibacillus sp. Ricciae_BoGa-3]WCK53428.1 pirin family protein [Aneurinibacillus sp. Ricciae_BoGa-3]
MAERSIRRLWTVQPHQQSPIHKVGQILTPEHYEEYDPFLFLAEDWFQHGVFDYHPHRGIETVTYVLEGTLEHYDNHGGEDKLEPGDAQWMTAGKGVIHKETAGVGDTVHSLQLWVNLPRSKKMTQPRYQNLRAKDMPVRKESGALVRIFSGSSAGVSANTLNHTPVTMVEIQLEPGASITQDLPGSYNGFFYVLEGRGYFGANAAEGRKNQVLWLGSADESQQSEISIRAEEKLRVLLYAGEPVKEAVVAYGPFVMNTEDEIRQAFTDFHEGKFE